MMNEKDYSEFEEACKIEHKSSVLRDMWNAIRKDDRPHWEVMADDGMNKFLKFCIFVISMLFYFIFLHFKCIFKNKINICKY